MMQSGIPVPAGFELLYVRNEADTDWEPLQVPREDGLGWEYFMVDRPSLLLLGGGSLLLQSGGHLILESA
jgi:hypothetical protein